MIMRLQKPGSRLVTLLPVLLFLCSPVHAERVGVLFLHVGEPRNIPLPHLNNPRT